MLPVIERLLYCPISTPVIRVLCLVPTRELAVQVFSVTQQLTQHTSIRVCLAAGNLFSYLRFFFDLFGHNKQLTSIMNTEQRGVCSKKILYLVIHFVT